MQLSPDVLQKRPQKGAGFGLFHWKLVKGEISQVPGFFPSPFSVCWGSTAAVSEVQEREEEEGEEEKEEEAL